MSHGPEDAKMRDARSLPAFKERTARGAAGFSAGRGFLE